MNKNILFFDIDGTLISEKDHSIPESTIKSIREIRKNGHLTFINTGRPASQIPATIKDIGFDGYVCGCGTYIEYKDEILLYRTLGKDLSRKIADDLKLYKLDGILEGKDDVYFDYEENIKNESILWLVECLKGEGFKPEKTWDDPELEFDKLVVFLREDSDFDSFHEKYKDTFEFINRDTGFYELVPVGFSKASGIKFLIEHLNIPYENTFALGDSTNDLSMLEYAKNSIAMGNSNPLLFDKVTFVTKTVDEDGIYHALKKYEMIK